MSVRDWSEARHFGTRVVYLKDEVRGRTQLDHGLLGAGRRNRIRGAGQARPVWWEEDTLPRAEPGGELGEMGHPVSVRTARVPGRRARPRRLLLEDPENHQEAHGQKPARLVALTWCRGVQPGKALPEQLSTPTCYVTLSEGVTSGGLARRSPSQADMSHPVS